jgi:predicted nucleotidyltransferase
MRFEDIPERLLSSATAIRVLRVLLTYPERELTGRQLAALARAPPQRANERLAALEHEGLVDRRVVGSAHLWKLNRRHFLARRLAGLFAIDAEAQAELRSTLRRWIDNQTGIAEARLFGSVARRSERPGSDVDLLLIVRGETARRRAEEAVGPLQSQIHERFGNPLSVIILTQAERAGRKGRGFVAAADAEGELLYSAA